MHIKKSLKMVYMSQKTKRRGKNKEGSTHEERERGKNMERRGKKNKQKEWTG